MAHCSVTEICMGNHTRDSSARIPQGSRQLSLTLKNGILTGRGGRQKTAAFFFFPQRKDEHLWLTGCKPLWSLVRASTKVCVLATKADGLHSQKQFSLYVWRICFQGRLGYVLDLDPTSSVTPCVFPVPGRN